MTLLAGVSPAKRERAMSRVFQCKKRDAILTRMMLFNLECFSCKNAYVMQGCRAGTKLSQRAGTIYSEPKSESDITSGTTTAPRKVVSNSY